MSHDHWPHEEEGQAPVVEQKPYEPFWVRWRKPVTDEQYIARIRRDKLKLKGWQPWLITLHFACSVLFFFLLGWMHKELTECVLANPWMIPPLVPVCAAMGFGIGLQLSQSITGLFQLLWGDRQADLLLRYHDLLAQHNLLPDSSNN